MKLSKGDDEGITGSIYLGSYKDGESRLSWRIDSIQPKHVTNDLLIKFGLRLAVLTKSLNAKIKQLEAEEAAAQGGQVGTENNDTQRKEVR